MCPPIAIDEKIQQFENLIKFITEEIKKKKLTQNVYLHICIQKCFQSRHLHTNRLTF